MPIFSATQKVVDLLISVTPAGINSAKHPGR